MQGFFAPILFFCFLLGENSGAKARSEAKRNGAILSQLNSGFLGWKKCGAKKGCVDELGKLRSASVAILTS